VPPSFYHSSPLPFLLLNLLTFTYLFILMFILFYSLPLSSFPALMFLLSPFGKTAPSRAWVTHHPSPNTSFNKLHNIFPHSIHFCYSDIGGSRFLQNLRTKLYTVTFQKTTILTLATVRTSNLIKLMLTWLSNIILLTLLTDYH
jgi:hypothetical protein